MSVGIAGVTSSGNYRFALISVEPPKAKTVPVAPSKAPVPVDLDPFDVVRQYAVRVGGGKHDAHRRRPSMREARLTAGPITVKSSRSGEPTLP